MNYWKKTYKFLLFFSLVVLFSACKSSKTAVTSGGAAVNKANEQLIDDILDAETKFRTINGKISLEMIAGNNTSGMKVNSQLKIIRDDIIQMSLRAPFINTEVFRIDITPDSVFIIDRMSKRYAIEDLTKLEKEKNIQFNYSNMQALFTNALFMPGKQMVGKTDYKNYDITMDAGSYRLQTKDKSGMIYNFVVDVNDRVTETHISGEKKNYALDWTYSDFIKDAGYIYPTKMAAKVNIEKKRLGLVISYSGIDIDKDFKIDRNLPSNYQKVSIMNILKNYIK